VTRVDTGDWERYVARYVLQATQETLHVVEQGVQEVRNEAINRTPVNTGALRAGWQVRSDKLGDRASFIVYNKTPYAATVEYGTKSHRILPKRAGGVLRFQAGGQTVFRKYVDKHPGTQPRPMIRPALDRVLPVLRRKLGA